MTADTCNILYEVFGAYSYIPDIGTHWIVADSKSVLNASDIGSGNMQE